MIAHYVFPFLWAFQAFTHRAIVSSQAHITVDQVATGAKRFVSNRKAWQSLLLAHWKDAAPRGKLRQILMDFRAFKGRLASSDALFAKLCHHAAQQEGAVEISCGATLQCFLDLFDGERQHMDYNKLLRLAANQQPQEAEHLMEIFRGGMDPVKSVATQSTRQLLVDIPSIALEQLSDQLLSDDEDNELPRIFDLHMEWNVIVEKEAISWNTGNKLGMVDIENRLCKQILSTFVGSLNYDYEGRTKMLESPDACRYIGAAFHAPIEVALRKFFKDQGSIVAMVRIPSFIPAKPGKWEAKDLEVELFRSHVASACAEQLAHEGVEVQQEQPTGHSAFSETCLTLTMSDTPVWVIDAEDGQNHVFAITKKGNDNFGVVQGYLSGAEPGYDLKHWLLSGNKFAAVDGFNKTVMREFLDRLSIFVKNSATNGVFDGSNHAAMFLVQEKHFVGKMYSAVLRYSELGGEVNVGRRHVKEFVIKPILKEVDSVVGDTSTNKEKQNATMAALPSHI